jgi:dolichol-phosphate mannosyltransferase
MTRVCVVIPTYNERENLPKLVSTVLRAFQDNQIDGWVLIVDDSSPDGTGEVANALSREHPNIQVTHRQGKLGLGSAYKDAFNTALIDQETQVIVEMDADFSHDPTYLPSIVKAAEESGGVAVGSRYMEGGQIVGWPRRRKIVSWGANFLVRAILGLPIGDATSGYRAFARQALMKIGYLDAGTKAYAFQVEMLHRCAQHKLPIVEVPITFYERRVGKSKLSKADMLDFLMTVLRLRFGF